jgi:7-cyano-7-deazaguanine synthase in queuosine biosynthesis
MSDNATEKVFVLLSGGVDSSTALALAKGDFPYAEFEAVTIDYGQRHKREIESAKAIADHYKVPHVVIDVKGLMTGMLVDKGEDNEEVPNVSYDELPKGISPTYVTFRNGLMISILAARAQGWVQQQQKGNLAVPYELTWSCYKGGEKHCGVCPTCRSRKDAFQQLKRAGFPILDPTVYEQ